MSFGFPTKAIEGYDDLERAILEAHSNHVLLFAAASNDGRNKGISYPARDEHVFCIHATDSNVKESSFTPNPLQDAVNFATIGEAVESAWPTDLFIDEDDDISHE